jgi:hypothetical protein
MTSDVGERYVQAIAAKDSEALLALLSPSIDFRALTPGRFWEASSPDEVVDGTIFGFWFEPTDQIEAIDNVEHGEVGSRQRVGYRFRVRNGDGAFLVEQQAYFECDAEQITWLRVMCSGYQPVEVATT